MDCDMLRRHLAQAEHHIELGKLHVSKQVEIVQHFADAGHDTTEARRLLDNFIQGLAQHVADRDRILRQLESYPLGLNRFGIPKSGWV